MSEPITYARAGGPPEDWCGLLIVDLDTGEQVAQVVEVNAAEGWLVRNRINEAGLPYLDETRREVARERIVGRFEIRRAVS